MANDRYKHVIAGFNRNLYRVKINASNSRMPPLLLIISKPHKSQ